MLFFSFVLCAISTDVFHVTHFKFLCIKAYEFVYMCKLYTGISYVGDVI